MLRLQLERLHQATLFWCCCADEWHSVHVERTGRHADSTITFRAPLDEDCEEDATAHKDDGTVPLEFTVTMMRNKGTTWGLEADHWADGKLQIVKLVEGGPVAEYNASVAEGLAPKVQLLDIVTAINGQPADAKGAKLLSSSKETTLTLKLVRPNRFHITLAKNGERWGVNLHYNQTRSTCLCVRQILSGAVATHNAQDAGDGPRPWHVEVNDLIEAVNGISGQPTQMMKEFSHCERADIVILRTQPTVPPRVVELEEP